MTILRFYYFKKLIFYFSNCSANTLSGRYDKEHQFVPFINYYRVYYSVSLYVTFRGTVCKVYFSHSQRGVRVPGNRGICEANLVSEELPCKLLGRFEASYFAASNSSQLRLSYTCCICSKDFCQYIDISYLQIYRYFIE